MPSEKSVDLVDVWCSENAVGLDDELRKSLALILDKVREERDAEVRRVVEEMKERIKHTSHKDGLGMGDQRSESVCDEILRRLFEEEP